MVQTATQLESVCTDIRVLARILAIFCTRCTGGNPGDVLGTVYVDSGAVLVVEIAKQLRSARSAVRRHTYSAVNLSPRCIMNIIRDAIAAARTALDVILVAQIATQW